MVDVGRPSGSAVWKDSVTTDENQYRRVNTRNHLVTWTDKSNERMFLLLLRLLNDTIFHDLIAIFKAGCSGVVGLP
jgi:hypothetical protein